MDSEKPSGRGKDGTIYSFEVSAEYDMAQHGDVVRQIAEHLTRETELVEKSDFVLIANQKNRTRKKLQDLE